MYGGVSTLGPSQDQEDQWEADCGQQPPPCPSLPGQFTVHKAMTAGFGSLTPVPIHEWAQVGGSLSTSTLQSCAGLVSVIIRVDELRVTPVDSLTRRAGKVQ